MDGFDLGAYLAEQRAEGTQESEGTFTVSTERALAKMASFTLPGPYDWVLKIVQAANAWHAPELLIRQTRVATSFFFCPPEDQEFPTAERVIGVLQSSALDNARPLDQLCMALRSLVDQCSLSFVLAIRLENTAGRPIFAGDDTTQLDQRVREAWATLSRPGVRLTVSHFKGHESVTGRYIPTFSRVMRRDVEIVRILETRAFASATPILVDGRLLTDLARHANWGHTRWYRPVQVASLAPEQGCFVGKAFPQHLPLGSIQIPEPSLRNRQPWYYLTTMEGTSLREQAMSLRETLGVLDERPLPMHHCVHWTRFGVVVHTRTILNECTDTTLAVFIPAEDYRSDLTGLSIDLEDEDTPRLRTLLGTILENLSSLAEEVPALVAEGGSESGQQVNRGRSEEAPMSAGFSIYTESLGRILPNLKAPARKAVELLEAWREKEEDRERQRQIWEKVVVKDLERMVDGLLGRLERKKQRPVTRRGWR